MTNPLDLALLLTDIDRITDDTIFSNITSSPTKTEHKWALNFIGRNLLRIPLEIPPQIIQKKKLLIAL